MSSVKPTWLWVCWIDSCLTNGECDKLEIEGPAKMQTVGILVERTERHVVIARDVHIRDCEIVGWRDSISIPIECVESITSLDIAGTTEMIQRVVVGADGEL